MRYKIKAPDTEHFEAVLRALDDVRVTVFAKSPRRRFVSTSELPSDVAEHVLASGGIIAEDRQHSPE